MFSCREGVEEIPPFGQWGWKPTNPAWDWTIGDRYAFGPMILTMTHLYGQLRKKTNRCSSKWLLCIHWITTDYSLAKLMSTVIVCMKDFTVFSYTRVYPDVKAYPLPPVKVSLELATFHGCLYAKCLCNPDDPIGKKNRLGKWLRNSFEI